MNAPHRFKPCAGFTLVELMVVIGVIGLLIGLLVPALKSVAASSRSTRCQLHLRQMATAAQNYAAVFDAYPAAIRYERINNIVHHISWDWVMASNQAVAPGALWMYTDNPGEVLQCPDYHGKPNFTGEPFTGYNYNTTYIGGETQTPGALGWKFVRRGVPPHACNRAAQCAMFGDAGLKGDSNKYMRAPMRSENISWFAIYSGGQAFRHSGWTNIAFVDGHIGSSNTPCAGKHANEDRLAQMGFPHNGFLSDDDSAYDPR